MVQIEGMNRALEDFDVFKDLDEDTRVLISGCAKNMVFQAGDYIYREGQKADAFYLIRHGVTSLEVHVPARDPLVIETMGDGEIIGWSWLVPPYRTRFDVRAVSLVRAVSIDAVCLRAKCEKDHSVGYEFYKAFLPVVSDRLSATRLQLIDMYGHPKDYEARKKAKASPPAKPAPAKKAGKKAAAKKKGK